MADEHSYIRSIHRKLKIIPGLDIWKIRADGTNGVADCWYSGVAGNIWVEYKYVKTLPKRGSTIIDPTNTNKYLSKLQQEWLRKKHEHNISTAVILGCSLGGVILKGLEWQTPLLTEDFRQKIISNKAIASFIQHFCTMAGTNEKQNYYKAG